MALTGDIVKGYLDRFPDAKTNTLSYKIYNENKEVFNSKEHTRDIIRYYRGAHGDRARLQITEKKYIREFKINHDMNAFNLPDSSEISYEPFIIPKSQDNILVLSDLHMPYHNISAIEAALKWGLEHEINTILLNGDIIDHYHQSRYVKDPRKRNYKYELEAVRQFLDSLKETFPNAVIYYKQGNHDERLEKYLFIKAPELLDVPDFQLKTLLRFGEKGIIEIAEQRIIRTGKLSILHGHEFGGGGGQSVNPARTLFNRGGANALVGHSHITSEHSQPSLNGELITCWSVGCLSELHPEFARLNKWNHGFARIKVFKDGSFRVNNIRIVDGRIY